MTRRVALVSCVKEKRTSPVAAKDLYVSQLFCGLRRYAEHHAEIWFVLSAEHGLIEPNQVIAPYEKTLNNMPKAERVAWAERVKQHLLIVLQDGDEIIFLAGLKYREELERFLRQRGVPVSVPFEGLPIGKQLQRLKEFAK